MAKFTLLELNLDGAQLSANTPFNSDPTLADGERVSDGEESDDESEGTKGPWLAALVGLLFLVVIALLVKKKVGGSDDVEDDPLAEDPALGA